MNHLDKIPAFYNPPEARGEGEKRLEGKKMGERVYKKKGRMKESDIFIEVDCFQKNKAGKR